MSDTRADVYSRITEQIEAAIAAGAGAWRMPWHHNGLSTARPINLASNKPYRGVNVLALWIAADAGGYVHGLWGTYRQWLAAGAQVRRGERGTTVVLWKQASGGSDERRSELEPLLPAGTRIAFTSGPAYQDHTRVGSAGGAENILGRWLGYASTGHGGNRELRKSDPTALSFSILERTSPDLDPSALVALENSWKDRLQTRVFGLNAN